MEIIGYILTFVTLAVGVIIAIIRTVHADLISARAVIERQYIVAYKEFAQAALRHITYEEGTQPYVARLKNLHCQSICDLPRLKRIEYFLNVTLVIVFCVVVGAIGSLIAGKLFLDEQHLIGRGVLLVGVPCLLMLSEFILLCAIVRIERYVKKVIVTYNNLEYQG